MSEREKMATNMSIRVIIDSLNDILGGNGAKVILKKAGVDHLFDTPPKNDWEAGVRRPGMRYLQRVQAR